MSSADPLTLRHLMTNQGLPRNNPSCDGKGLVINKKIFCSYILPEEPYSLRSSITVTEDGDPV